MKNVIVASYKEEAKAIDALHKLKEMELSGDISIYEFIMVRKKASGEIEVLQKDDAEGWRTFTGMGVGSLIGALGGPVGLLIGLYTGAAIGAIADADYYDFAEDFIAKIENKIPVGNVSIIAETEEDSKVFIDTELKPFGGVITRSGVDYEYDKFTNEQLDAIEEEMEADRAALKKAMGDNKKKIQKKIAELKEKRRNLVAAFEKKIKDTVASGKTKVEGLGKDIKESMREGKIERLRERIDWHNERLSDLKQKLDTYEHEHA